MVHRGYYAIIPAHVRYDKDLTPNAKLLYGEITALCNEKGYCWAGDSYFAKLYGVGKNTIQRWLKQLEDKNYISRKVIYEEGTRNIKGRYIYLCDNPTPKKECTPIPKNEGDNITSFNNEEEEEINPVKLFEKNFYPMTPMQMESLWQWVDDFHGNTEVICMAIKETALKNPSSPFKYLEGILIDWHKRKMFTKDDVLRNKKYQTNKKQISETSNVPPIREIDFSEGEDY